MIYARMRHGPSRAPALSLALIFAMALEMAAAGAFAAPAPAGAAPARAADAPTTLSAAPDHVSVIAPPRLAARLPWGRGRRASGRISGPEYESAGPISFCLERGGAAALLLDSAQAQVKRVDLRTGEVAVLAREARGEAVCPDGAGGFYMRDEGEVARFDAAGRRVAAAPLCPAAASQAGYGVELLAGSDGGASLLLLDQRELRLTGREKAAADGEAADFLAPAAQAASARLGRPGADGGAKAPAQAGAAPAGELLRFYIKRMDGAEVRLLGLDEEGKVRVSAPVRLAAGRPGAALFRGADAKGRLYVEIERIGEGGPERAIGLEVHRFAPDGRPLAVFDLPNDYTTPLYKKTEITPDGAIVQMLTRERGVEFLVHGP